MGSKKYFCVYGSWEALGSVKILPRGAPTFSTPGKPHSENFFFSTFWTSPNACFWCVWAVLGTWGYLETFLECRASFWQSMSPIRATSTQFSPNIIKFCKTWTPHILKLIGIWCCHSRRGFISLLKSRVLVLPFPQGLYFPPKSRESVLPFPQGLYFPPKNNNCP